MSNLQTIYLGLNDVYDFAYDIAQEFEKILIFCDIDVLKPVIDKVINVLEILETNIQRIEQLEAEVRNLKSNNLQLYSEKIVSDQEKCKLRRIYEESEESWLEEVVILKSQLSSLRSENDMLKSHLADRKDSFSKSDDKLDSTIQNQSGIIIKLKQILSQKEKQLQDNISTINVLNSRIQELLKMNEILHLKNQETRNDISKLIIEKNDSKKELMLHKRENVLLNETIQELLKNSRMQKKEEMYMPNKSSEYTYEEILSDNLSCYQQEITLEDKIKKLQLELQSLRAKSKQYERSISNTNSQNKVPISRIHQLFHLFLGITKFSWF